MHNLSPPFKCCISQLVSCLLMDLVRLSGEKKLEIKKLTGGKSSPRNSVIAHHVQKYFFTHPYTGVLVYRIPFSIFQIHSEGKKLYAQMRPKALLSIEKVKAYIRRENILKCPGEVFVRAFLSNPPCPPSPTPQILFSYLILLLLFSSILPLL